MAEYGMTSDGFSRKRLADIKSDLEARLKEIFGNNIDLQAESVFGQFVGIASEVAADQWESQENVYFSEYPNTASGQQLSNAVKLNGLTRQEARSSTVTALITGTNGTVIPVGSKASTSDTGAVFVTLSEVTIGSGGTVDVDMESENTGVIEATSGTLTIIETPIFGWASITNALDAIPGRDEETDVELRERQADSTLAAGQNNADALFGQLRNVDGVFDALVLENKTNVTDSNGIPPHEFECVVKGGTDEDVAQVIWTNTPQGIQSHGNQTEVVTDAQGLPQNVYFTRPTEITIYVEIDITVDTSTFPTSGEDDIKQAVVDYGEDNFLISDNVIYSQLYTPINQTPGILTIDLTIGTSPSPTGTSNIVIDFDEISSWLITNVEVNIV